MAQDLAQRFKQHNGIIRAKPSSCKVREIRQYFEEHDRLGYAVLMQSPIAQPRTSRNKALFQPGSASDDLLSEITGDVLEDIRVTEGLFLEAYRQVHNGLPPWNKIHGAVEGQLRATEWDYLLVRHFGINTDSPLTARSTLREVADNALYAGHEIFLHAIRMTMLGGGIEFDEACDMQRRWDDLNGLVSLSRPTSPEQNANRCPSQYRLGHACGGLA